MNLKPLRDNIVVKQAEAEVKTESGLYLSSDAQEKPSQGEVIAVGEGRFHEDGGDRIPMDVKVGDKVLYGKYAGNPVKIGSEEYLIMSETDVVAIIE